jgi:hypothetical protein
MSPGDNGNHNNFCYTANARNQSGGLGPEGMPMGGAGGVSMHADGSSGSVAGGNVCMKAGAERGGGSMVTSGGNDGVVLEAAAEMPSLSGGGGGVSMSGGDAVQISSGAGGSTTIASDDSTSTGGDVSMITGGAAASSSGALSMSAGAAASSGTGGETGVGDIEVCTGAGSVGAAGSVGVTTAAADLAEAKAAEEKTKQDQDQATFHLQALLDNGPTSESTRTLQAAIEAAEAIGLSGRNSTALKKVLHNIHAIIYHAPPSLHLLCELVCCVDRL